MSTEIALSTNNYENPPFAEDLVEDEKLLLSPDRIEKEELYDIQRQGGIRCVAYAMLLLSGIPALALAMAWDRPGIASAIGLPTVESLAVFTMFYFAGLGCLIPIVAALLGTSAMASVSDRLAAVLELAPNGLRWVPPNRWVGKALNMSGTHTQSFPWSSICAVTYGPPELSILRKHRLAPNFVATAPLHGNAIFLFERGDGQRLARRFKIIPSSFSLDQRRKLLRALEQWASHADVAPKVREVLIGESTTATDPKHTQLWPELLESACQPRSDHLSPGEQLANGAYRIIRRIHTGGQANMYEAVVEECLFSAAASSLRPGNKVVLKEFIPCAARVDAARLQSLSSFEHEASLLSRLSYPKIVKLMDLFVENGRAYLVLEYAGGCSLRQLVDQKGAIREERVIPLAVQMCEVLSFLHQQTPPIVHRDFTPDNLILNASGEVKLVDFCVASEGEIHDPSPLVVGKQCYIPPEQFQGKAVVQSDIYALGATLFFLLTGENPDPISEAHPRDLNHSISRALDAFVARCTALDTSSRYQTVAELLADLPDISNYVR